MIGDVPRLDMETISMTPEDIVSQGLPYILHFSSVSKWSAFTKMARLELFKTSVGKESHDNVSCEIGETERDVTVRSSFLNFPSSVLPLFSTGTSYTKNESPWLHDVPCPFEETNMTSETLLNRLHDAATTTSSSHFLQAFSSFQTRSKLTSHRLENSTVELLIEKSRCDFCGSQHRVLPHIFHFDQDHNFFARSCRKRFTLIPASRFRRHASVSKITSHGTSLKFTSVVRI